MRIYTSINNNRESCVATVGFFDGVHAGHRFLIEQLKSISSKCNLPSAVITFREHPFTVVRPHLAPKLLTSLDEKLALLEATGIQYCFILDFDKAMSELSAMDFLKQVLDEKLCVKHLLVGHDHRFGRNRSDSFADYQRYGQAIGMGVYEATKYAPEGLTISATQIRQDILDGDISQAALKLSHPYTLQGMIVEGFKNGRTMGFPTANIQPSETLKLIPAHGVYAVRVTVSGAVYGAMLNIGTRPTLQNGSNVSIEAHIFDFDGDVYGKSITVEFVKRIRQEERFDNVDQLKSQLMNDKLSSLKILSQ